MVEARPPSRTYQLQKLFQRNRSLALSILFAVSVLVLGTLISIAGWVQQWQTAVQLREQEKETVIALNEQKAATRRAETAETAAIAIADDLRRDRYISDMIAVQQAWESSNIARVQVLLRRQPEDLRGFEWRYFWRLCQLSNHPVLEVPNVATSLAYSPDGTRLAVGLAGPSNDGLVALLDTVTRKRLDLFGPGKDWVKGVTFANDGKTLAYPGDVTGVVLRDLETLSERPLPTDSTVHALATSPDGQFLVAGAKNGKIYSWDTHNGFLARQPWSCHKASVFAVAFTPNSDRLATAGNDGVVRVWDVATGRQVGGDLRGCTRKLGGAIAFSPDGRRLASSTDADARGKYQVQIHSLESGEISTFYDHDDEIRAMAFSSDGTFASGSRDNTIKLWDVDVGQEIATLKGHASYVQSLAFRPGDGLVLASASRDGTVKLWQIDSTAKWRASLTTPTPIRDACWSKSMDSLLTLEVNGTVRKWNADSGESQVAPIFASPTATKLAASDDGTVAAISSDRIELWNPRHENVRVLTKKANARISEGTHDFAMSADGHFLAYITNSDEVAVWDLRPVDGTCRMLITHDRPIAIHVSTRANQIAVGGVFGTISVWTLDSGFTPVEVASGRRPARMEASSAAEKDAESGDGMVNQASVQALAFSEDGSILATGGGDSAITVWRVDRAKQKFNVMGVLRGHSGPIRDLKFSADGRTLFSAGGERTIRVWDVAKSTERAIFRGHRIPARKLLLSSSENVLLSLSLNWAGGPEFRVWRAATPEQGSLP